MKTRWIAFFLVVAAWMAVSSCRPKRPDALARPAKTQSAGGVTAHDDAETASSRPAPAVHDAKPGRSAPSAGVANSEAEGTDANAQDAKNAAKSDTPAPAPADEPTTTGKARGVAWEVPARWPKIGDGDEFRVGTWRLPAVSMAGAGECALYRFPGGGKPEDNLHRWMSQFRGPDGTVDTVNAAQAKRTIHGVQAYLVRAEGTYVATTPGMKGPGEEHENYALFGAVIMATGQPVFAKCTGPIEVIAHEANAILAWVDSLMASPI